MPHPQHLLEQLNQVVVELRGELESRHRHVVHRLFEFAWIEWDRVRTVVD